MVATATQNKGAYLTTADVATLLNVDRHTIINLVHRRQIKAVWVGSNIRIHPDALAEFIATSTRRR